MRVDGVVNIQNSTDHIGDSFDPRVAVALSEAEKAFSIYEKSLLYYEASDEDKLEVEAELKYRSIFDATNESYRKLQSFLSKLPKTIEKELIEKAFFVRLIESISSATMAYYINAFSALINRHDAIAKVFGNAYKKCDNEELKKLIRAPSFAGKSVDTLTDNYFELIKSIETEIKKYISSKKWVSFHNEYSLLYSRCELLILEIDHLTRRAESFMAQEASDLQFDIAYKQVEMAYHNLGWAKKGIIIAFGSAFISAISAALAWYSLVKGDPTLEPINDIRGYLFATNELEEQGRIQTISESMVDIQNSISGPKDSLRELLKSQTQTTPFMSEDQVNELLTDISNIEKKLIGDGDEKNQSIAQLLTSINDKLDGLSPEPATNSSNPSDDTAQQINNLIGKIDTLLGKLPPVTPATDNSSIERDLEKIKDLLIQINESLQSPVEQHGLINFHKNP